MCVPRDMTAAGMAMMAVIATAGGIAACAGPDPATPEAFQDRVAAGEALYAIHCQTCHGDRDGMGRTGVAPPHNEQGHTWHHADAQLKDWVMDGKIGFGEMPAFRDELSEAEVSDILAYIKTWWTPEQREFQADISRRYEEALERQEGGR